EAPQDAQLVHQGKRWENRAGLVEDRAEARVGRGGVEDVLRDERQRFADEALQGEIRLGVERLAVAENADEPFGRLPEDVGRFHAEFPSAKNEAVDAARFLVAVRAERFEEGRGGARLVAKREGET